MTSESFSHGTRTLDLTRNPGEYECSRHLQATECRCAVETRQSTSHNKSCERPRYAVLSTTCVPDAPASRWPLMICSCWSGQSLAFNQTASASQRLLVKTVYSGVATRLLQWWQERLTTSATYDHMITCANCDRSAWSLQANTAERVDARRQLYGTPSQIRVDEFL